MNTHPASDPELRSEQLLRVLARVTMLCRRSASDFRRAATEVEDPDLRAVLERHAEQRDGFISQVEQAVAEVRGPADRFAAVGEPASVSDGASVEAGETLADETGPGGLRRAEHSERLVLRHYRRLVAALPPGDAQDLLKQQQSAVEASLERLRELSARADDHPIPTPAA